MGKVPNSLEKLSRLVGNTPLLQISCRFEGKNTDIYAKYEAWNYSGSIKDRMALQILKNAYLVDTISPEDVIVEATSGNTGIAFAAMGAFLGHSVEIYMPDWLSEERKRLLRFYGAKLHEISVEEGGFLKCIELAAVRSLTNGYFCPEQFKNSNNVLAHYRNTAPEMNKDLQKSKIQKIDAFVAGAGTGGTIMGFFRYFSEKNKYFQAHPVFPVNNSDGSHRIEGIGDSFVPEILLLDELNKTIRISDSDAINVARAVNKKGLSVGISSGANILAALIKSRDMPKGSIVGTILCDDNKKYLSTDLFSDIKEKQNYDFDVLDYKVLP